MLRRKIPELIHMIWLGSSLNNDYIKRILSLANIAKRSHFKLTLWVDDEDNFYRSPFLKNLDAQLGFNLKAEQLGVCIRNISEIFTYLEECDLFSNGKEQMQFSNYIKREMIGLSNLGAASDFFRYVILYKEGGYYFDCDTTFNFDENNILIADDEPVLGILVNITLEQNENDSLEVLTSNDIIAAMPGNNALKYSIKYMKEKYAEFDQTLEIENKDILINENATDPDKIKEYHATYDHKISINTTTMDAKRYPFAFTFPNPSRKKQLTIDSSGPQALLIGIDSAIASQKDIETTSYSQKYASVSIPKTTNNQLLLANMQLSTGYDGSWLISQAPKYYEEKDIYKYRFFQKHRSTESIPENSRQKRKLIPEEFNPKLKKQKK